MTKALDGLLVVDLTVEFWGSLAAALSESVFGLEPVSAATSRAIPARPRQSPRFGVTPTSKSQSCSPFSGSRMAVKDSTSRPAIVRVLARSCGAELHSTNSLSHLKVNFIKSG